MFTFANQILKKMILKDQVKDLLERRDALRRHL
jgi:flagellar hook-associated protein FlgK